MKRRSFLKLACLAVVAPSTLIPKPKHLSFNALLRLIRRRRDTAMQALIDDYEWQYRNSPIGVAMEDISKESWGWVILGNSYHSHVK